MTHFIAVVILPKGVEPSNNTEAMEQVGPLIAAYDEEREVPKYVVECWCNSDPECSDCMGTGIRTTTYNPDSRWDWWEVGGRWNGYFGGRNIAPVAELPEACIPKHIVTPDGRWHAAERTLWFGMADPLMSDDEWNNRARGIYAEHLGHVAVAIDGHI